jgi:AraC family L-rhamnose operon transcriptional activator RhaR
MRKPANVQRLTLKNTFLDEHAPYAIVRHSIDGDRHKVPHDHDFIELVLISGGTGIQWTPFGQMPLRKGSLFILHPDVWHSYLDCFEMVVNVCAIAPQLLEYKLCWLKADPGIHYLLWERGMLPHSSATACHHLTDEDTDLCSRRFFELQRSEHRRSPQSHAIQIGALTCFLAELAECVMPTRSVTQHRLESEQPDFVRKTIEKFAENLAHDWVITDLSDGFGVTASYFIRIFKRVLGASPLEYLSTMRARRAAEALICSDFKISEIAIEVGWHEPGYFSRRFRQYYGMSPREYRSRYGLGNRP